MEDFKFDRMEVRLSTELKEEFDTTVNECKEIRSDVIRKLMQDYIEENKEVEKID